MTDKLALCNVELHGLYSLKELIDMCSPSYNLRDKIGVFRGTDGQIEVKAVVNVGLPIKDFQVKNPRVWEVIEIKEEK